MKTNEIPKKIYLSFEDKNLKNVEYIRTDAFIEDTCEWVSSHLPMQYDGLSAFTNAFRKAMKRKKQ